MAKNKRKELGIQSLLMFNKLDSQAKIVKNVSDSVDKRKKAVHTIFETYRLVLSPFFDITEDKKYVGELKKKILEREESLNQLVSKEGTGLLINAELTPILEHLKKTVKTCKLNHDELKEVIKF